MKVICPACHGKGGTYFYDLQPTVSGPWRKCTYCYGKKKLEFGEFRDKELGIETINGHCVHCDKIIQLNARTFVPGKKYYCWPCFSELDNEEYKEMAEKFRESLNDGFV